MNQKPFINGLSIESFGALQGLNISQIDSGLNVIAGSNEAGKSTIRNAISQGLFGVVTNRRTGNMYKVGNRNRKFSLRIKDGEETYVVSRNEKDTTITVNGLAVSEDDFKEKFLFGLDTNLFDSVFSFDAFSASDLLSTPDIASYFVMAGSGSLEPPAEVQKRLLEEKESLFGGHANKKDVHIRDLRNKLIELQTESRDLQQQADQTAQEAKELSRLTGKIQVVDRQKRDLQAKKAKQEDALTALRTGVDAQNKLKAQRKELEQELKESEQARDALSQETYLIEHTRTLEQLMEERSLISSRLEDAEDLDRQIVEKQQQLSELADIELENPSAFLQEVSTLQAGITHASQELSKAQTLRDEGAVTLREEQARFESVPASQDVAAAMANQQKPLYLGAVILGLVAAVVLVFSFIKEQPAVTLGALALFLGAGLMAIFAYKRVGNIDVAHHLEDRQESLTNAKVNQASLEELVIQRERDVEEAKQALLSYAQSQGVNTETLDEQSLINVGTQAQQRREIEIEVKRLTAQQAGLNQKVSEWNASFEAFLSVLDKPEANPLSPMQDHDDQLNLQNKARNYLLAGRDFLLEAQQQRENQQQREDIGRNISNYSQNLSVVNEELRLGYERMQNALPSDISLENQGEKEVTVRLEQELEDMAAQLNSYEDELSQLSRQQGELEERLRAANTDTRMQNNAQAIENTKTQLKNAENRYVQVVLKNALFSSAIQKWETERKPEIDTIANDYLKLLTGGDWTGVVMDDKKVFALNDFGERREGRFLSTGTLGQVYLAIRLALIETNPDLGVAAPVLMDDAFVHFDESRRKNALDALERLAKHRQVIYFTHDEDLAGAMVSRGAHRVMMR